MSGTEQVRLVTMSEQHLDATWKWLSQSKTLRDQVDCQEPPTIEVNAAYWRQQWKIPGREDYAILDQQGRHVGNCGLRGIDRKRLKAELWIYLGEARGRGIGTAAVRRLMARAFDELALNRLFLRVVDGNEGARRFYLGLGFMEEGRWREDTLVDGRFVDSSWFSMLSGEYAASRRPGVGAA